MTASESQTASVVGDMEITSAEAAAVKGEKSNEVPHIQ